MSRHETWRTRLYWNRIGGLLIEEYRAIASDAGNSTGKRVIDGIIVLGEEPRIQKGGKFDFKDRDIIVIQTKATRLGMYLMGQAFFSKKIMERFEPKSIKAVAIAGKEDPEMRALCEAEGVEVVIIEEAEKP